ncbi:hypothetical protein ANCCAN_17017 [Ancylostoma caninum]|uniref:SCP domain-containing protein n=1 Tax=Ancylostoma caninum TaxID=29170 RepID=A0A368G3A9_ANCCA|nr:hypothetical protein ANCCAN_17017 [Ancylostoma caninum]
MEEITTTRQKGPTIMTMLYNCTLEKDAQMYADLCTSAGSPEAQRPLWGENFNVIEDTLDPILAVSRDKVVSPKIDSYINCALGYGWIRYECGMTLTRFR